MTLWQSILVLIVGFAILSGGAKFLCDAVIQLADRLNISSTIAGVFLISIGTTAPDLMAVTVAMLEGHPDISIGNILGSNFANLALGFGVAALICPFKCDKKLLKIEFPVLFTATILFVVHCLDGNLARLEGAFLLFLFCVYLLHSLSSKRTKSPEIQKQKLVNGNSNLSNVHVWRWKKSLLLFIFGSGLLALGAHFVVHSCCRIADSLNLSQNFIGFSLLAFGTSAPEIMVVTAAAKRGQYTICSGNIIGSNLINLMVVSGICALIHPFFFEKNIFVIEAAALIFITVLTWVVFKTKQVFSRTCGAIFVAIYFIAMFLLKTR